ncbi:MAG: NAD(P)H-dependent glycerol-3-phosphate dehydrogenase [Alphaproteobacteria bacterium]|nr:NAD(P)H-dependent glycerol-3-phosphate dehydrogenase [Alphaproteobacteria bacterium]
MKQGAAFGRVSVIGGGAWGSALANLAAHNGIETLIWARETEVADAINARHENAVYLPGVRLHTALKATCDLAAAADKADAFLLVAPAQHCRGILAALKSAGADADAPIALCAKGIEQGTDALPSQVISAVWPSARPAVLSGPSFARDVALGLPTAVTLACADASLGARWIATVGAPHFRPYLSDDIIGAELGGAVKNVLAIAAGVVEGKGLGESARAALITRGFAEFQRLGRALGAKSETMAGLSGLGDLILTASSRQSRNMSLGVELGKGRKAAEVLAERVSVAEGVFTAPALAQLAERRGVDMPIAAAVAALVADEMTVDEVIAGLLSRPFKHETA